MFSIIYEKSNGRVTRITTESNAESLRKAIPETSDFMFVEELPQVTPYRQIMVVKNKVLTVENLKLTSEQEEEIEKLELNILRDRRQDECFSVINRGKLWYDTLTETQLKELNTWYKEWLDVTDTKAIPRRPSWLK